MTVVVDARAAVAIASGNGFAPGFQEVLNEAEAVLAPDTFPAEITNVLWKDGQHSNLAADKCRRVRTRTTAGKMERMRNV